MADPNNFSELLEPNHPDPHSEGLNQLVQALDEQEAIVGMDPAAFQRLGRRERIEMTRKEYNAMDEMATAIKTASSDPVDTIPPKFTSKEINPENRGQRYGQRPMLDEDDYSLVFGSHEVSVNGRQTHDTGNENDPNYRFLAGDMSSGEWSGITQWGNLSKHNLVRKNIDAVNKTNATIEGLSGHPAVQTALENLKDLKVARTADAKIDQVKGDVSEAEMEKYALMRGVSEGVLTAAQSLAIIMADSQIEADIKVVGQKAVEGRWVEHMARGIPIGVTGPLAIGGLVPEGGLLTGTAQDPRLADDFRDELMENVRRRTKEIDLKLAAVKTMAMGEVATESLTQGQHDALVELARIAHSRHIFDRVEHLMETGCPAGAHGKAKNEGLITVVTKMLVDNL